MNKSIYHGHLQGASVELINNTTVTVNGDHRFPYPSAVQAQNVAAQNGDDPARVYYSLGEVSPGDDVCVTVEGTEHSVEADKTNWHMFLIKIVSKHEIQTSFIDDQVSQEGAE
ncbi:hypothetical protein [Planctomycetes bacterium K23_9]|nr:hypothetical protein K239x_24530 [Planctomycetes bacterium K23_9]